MPAAASSLGSILRQERLRKELSLAVIARQTKICIYILEAIEGDRFDDMPAGAYRRHFIRQYACALGMDGEAAVAEYRIQYQEAPVPLPVPVKTRRPRLWSDFAWALAAIAGIASAYHFSQTKHPEWNFTNIAARTVETIHSRGEAARVSPEPTPKSQASATPPLPPTSPATPLHVAFTATEPVWMSVKCDGNTSYSGVLEVPQSRNFDAAGTVTALVGNAGGLLIWLNGKPLGSLGAHGEVELIELTLNGARRIARRALLPTDQNSIPQP